MKRELKYFLLFVLLVPCVGIGLRPNGDFGIYTSVGNYLRGATPGNFYQTAGNTLHFFYGVPFLPLTTLFTLLPPLDTYWVWLSIQFLAFVGFWFFLFKLFPALISNSTSWLFMLVWAVSIKPLHASFQSANVQMIFAAVLVFAEYLTSRDANWKRFLGGSLVTPLVLFKIFPIYVVIAYFLLKGRHVIWGMVAGGVTWLLLPFLVFGGATGWELYQGYASHIVHFHSPYSLARMTVNLSLPSLVSYWFLGLGEDTSNRIAFLVSTSLSIAFLIQLIRLRQAHAKWSSDLWAYTLAVMTLLNSGARPDYFVFYVPAFAAIAELLSQMRMPKWFSFALFLSFSLIALISEWTLGSREMGHALEAMRIPVLGMILLWFLLLYGIKKPSTQSA